MLKERLKKLLSILMVVGVLTGGLFFVSGERSFRQTSNKKC